MRVNLAPRVEKSNVTSVLILSIIFVSYVTTLEVAARRDQRQRKELFEAETGGGKNNSSGIIGFGRKTETTPRQLGYTSGESKENSTSAIKALQSTSLEKITTLRNGANGRQSAKNSSSRTAGKLPIITSSRRNASQYETLSTAHLKDLQRKRAGPERSAQKSDAARRSVPLTFSATSNAPFKTSSPNIQLKGLASKSHENISWGRGHPSGSSSSVSGASATDHSRLARARAKTSTTTTTTATTTLTTTSSPSHLQRNRNTADDIPFGFIPKTLWYLSGPPATTPLQTKSIKKHPKKYTPPQPTHPQDTPLRVALPTPDFRNHSPSLLDIRERKAEKEKRASLQMARERFDCPRESEVRFQLFPKICKVDKDCHLWSKDEICCEIFGAKSCVNGIPKPLEETSHYPLLGLIPRKCPTRPLAELWWDVKECQTDNDCWPRVCCPDGRKRYCRTSEPELEVVPVPVPVKRSFHYLTEYLECTPPPPPIFDLHPKPCASTFDCFPNVCCQEAGLRHCRPPKKSVLTLMANFLNVGFVKRLTQNIIIK